MLMRALSAVIETALLESFTVSAPDHDLAKLEVVVARHEKIVDAIEARDPEAASVAMSAVIVRGVSSSADRFVT
jgi:DNA-binding FadR family transcriptional regulator